MFIDVHQWKNPNLNMKYEFRGGKRISNAGWKGFIVCICAFFEGVHVGNTAPVPCMYLYSTADMMNNCHTKFL